MNNVNMISGRNLGECEGNNPALACYKTGTPSAPDSLTYVPSPASRHTVFPLPPGPLAPHSSSPSHPLPTLCHSLTRSPTAFTSPAPDTATATRSLPTVSTLPAQPSPTVPGPSQAPPPPRTQHCPTQADTHGNDDRSVHSSPRPLRTPPLRWSRSRAPQLRDPHGTCQWGSKKSEGVAGHPMAIANGVHGTCQWQPTTR